MYMVSCRSVSKVVYQNKMTDMKFRYFVSENPNYRKGEGKFYARVDSGNVRVFYSFQANNIYKTYANVSNYVYTLVFDRQSMLRLTAMDTIVLTKADNLLDSLGNNDLKRSKNATGFVLEIAGH